MTRKFSPAETASHKQGIFGLPMNREYAKVCLLPVPWDVTTSYHAGAAQGPQAILEASPQLDLFDMELGRIYEPGIYMAPIEQQLQNQNVACRDMAEKVMNELEEWGSLTEHGLSLREKVNHGCQQMVDSVYAETQALLQEGKLVGIIGGDHSCPLGAIKALSEHYEGDYSILHIDAHADLREHYQGFTYSHASIMNNVTKLAYSPKKLVQVGIRDFCEEEHIYAQERPEIQVFYDAWIKRELFSGQTWSGLCQQMLEPLSDKVYLSFDIDGLSPEFCPHTGTPVPGGLNYDQAVHLIAELGRSGRRIIGFDLNEVAPAADAENQWDGNVGARLVYKMCGWMLASQGLLKGTRLS